MLTGDSGVASSNDFAPFFNCFKDLDFLDVSLTSLTGSFCGLIRSLTTFCCSLADGRLFGGNTSLIRILVKSEVPLLAAEERLDFLVLSGNSDGGFKP